MERVKRRAAKVKTAGGRRPSYGMTHTATRPATDQRRTAWTNISPKQAEILDRAFDLVQSVPYRVSLRWLFYRLYQDGLYTSKEDYKSKFGPLLSRARHTLYKGWRPDTVEDETREAVVMTGGYSGAEAAFDGLGPRLFAAARVDIDHFYRQRKYIELWFEARAMAGQFQHYTRDIDLVPMAGQASIPFKWNLAKRLEAAAGRYGLPIVLLYFGDEDLAGHVIGETIRLDVARWCAVPFEFERCGLSIEQAKKYNVPESIEKKGYQWEALDDAAAEEIITTAVEKYIDVDLIDEADEEAEAASDKCAEAVERVLESMRGRP